jgi:hypothetical protein
MGKQGSLSIGAIQALRMPFLSKAEKDQAESHI